MSRHKPSSEPLMILVDKREQLPWAFIDYNVQIIYDILPTGDYSMFGFKDTVAVERKSLSDLFGSLNNKEKHEEFMEKMYKLSKYECRAIVIESSLERISNPQNVHSKLNPKSVISTLAKATAILNVPAVFASGRRQAQYFVHQMFMHYRASKTSLKMELDPKLKRTFIPMIV